MLLLGLSLGVAAAGTGHGSLDPSFGQRGIVRTTIDTKTDADAHVLVVQGDGKLVAGGDRDFFGDDSLTVVRYRSNGSLDHSFGSAGVVRDGPPGGANALVIQRDGKLVAAGVGFTLVRLRPNGGLDRSFGKGGLVTTVFGSIGDVADGLVIQPDGKLVASGSSAYKYAEGGSTYDHFALARYNPGGSLDTSFGSGGKVVTAIGVDDTPYGLVLQRDGKLVLEGDTVKGLTLVRYNKDGSLDRSFGQGGIASAHFEYGSDVGALVIQKDGKLVAAGAGIARFNSNGTLDRGFGSSGKVSTSAWTDGIDALALQRDGKLIAAGEGKVDNVDDGNGFLLARYNSDGRLDRGFGTGGKVRTQLGPGLGFAEALAIQSDGKPVALGASDGRFTLARYLK